MNASSAWTEYKPQPTMPWYRELSGAILEKWRSEIGLEPSEHVTDALCIPLGNIDVDQYYHAHFQMRWAQLGFPTFELTHGLTSALLLTDLRGQRGLRPPFDTFAIVLPSPSPVVFTDAVGAQTAGRWIFAHKFRKPDGSFHRRRMDVAEARALPGSRSWSWLSCPSTSGYAIHRDEEWPHDDEPLEKWLSILRTRCDDADRHGFLTMFRLVANLCCYISSLPAMKMEERGAVNGRRIGSVDYPRRFVLGREIKLPSGLHKAAADGASAGGFRLHARFVVRGHWRNQACGARRVERKLRWIMPYWKGPNTAEGLARLYSVSERGL